MTDSGRFKFSSRMKRKLFAAAFLLLLPFAAGAAEVMTLQQCRDSAVRNNISLKMAQQKVTLAGYDRKIAMANYFPGISVTGAYMYNSRNLSLLSQEKSDMLTGLGTGIQGSLHSGLENLMSDPVFSAILQENPGIMKLMEELMSADIASSVNAIGSEINRAFELDIHNVFAGTVSLRQPVFAGGKIINANRLAKLAEDLARSQYDMEYRAVVSEVDNAYWQIVSISNKKRLAQDYADLLEMMLHDTEVLVEEGMATRADLLSVKVRANEADLLLTKAGNGLVLAKMLLCRLCGLPLDTELELADECLDKVPLPIMGGRASEEEIFASRPEIRSLELASRIYGRKAAIARADMMPKVALTANYLLTNPNMYHGYSNSFAGMFNVGVAVEIPVFHGCEAMQKVRRAKAESVMAECMLEDAKKKIAMQVEQLRRQEDEALEKLCMAENSLGCAEENLRTATAGYAEGMVPANTLMQAQTAWMQAHSEYIDAGVELQLHAVALALAEGR